MCRRKQPFHVVRTKSRPFTGQKAECLESRDEFGRHYDALASRSMSPQAAD